MGERGGRSGFSLARSLMKQTELHTISSLVFAWYKKHARNLPWRRTSHPYRILVSEVMLQQTQVDRVIEKYKTFLRAFPTVAALATAAPRDVIIAWQGLGYNRRALFLQKTAQAIQKKHHGKFPKDLAALKTLPGVGDYTARAILSFAFDRAVPMLDTNHRQFYERVYFGGRKTTDAALLKQAEKLVDMIHRAWSMEHGAWNIGHGTWSKEHGTNVCSFQKKKSAVYHWNQALMDFMSALRKYETGNSGDPLFAQFANAFPAGKKEQKIKKQSVLFRDSDRWYRGRIIDALREKRYITIAALGKRFQEISNERLKKIVLQLEKDGLIQREKNRILLP